MIACDVSQRVGILRKTQLRLLLGQHPRGLPGAGCAADPWKWGGANGAWILSPAQVDALQP